MPAISIVVFCGLPGVGKSTLCENLCSKLQNITFIHVNFDELIPQDVEKKLIENRSDVGAWKEHRGYVRKLIGKKLSEIIATGEKEASTVDDMSQIPEKLAKDFEQKWLRIGSAENIIVLVDDNMYYSSMRYEYYQVARQYKVGFGQVFFDVPLSKALERNARRNPEKIVTKEVIETMTTRIEAPSGEQWEKHSFKVQDDVGNFDSLLEFFHHTLENPVQPVQEIDPELQEKSRVACSESVIYQTDQILRKLVSEHMTALKSGLDKTGLKEEGIKVNTVRTGIISAMKKQEILLDCSIVENSTDAALNKCSPLYEFVRDLFERRVK